MNEREIIERHFAGRLGRFLELGANDGERNSLTAGLVTAGWSGVQVEPEPLTFLRLLGNREGNPRIELVNAAIGPQSGVEPFWAQVDGGENSTLSDRHREVFAANDGIPFHRPYWINVLSVAGLLAEFGGPTNWQLVLIDVEGVSVKVLEWFPLAAMTDTEVLCVEHDNQPEYAARLMQPWYSTQVIGVNVLGIRR
jgi:FkbM family methyltransferase